MLICILEYEGSYIGGTIVAIVEEVADLPELVREEADPGCPVFIDGPSCQWYKLVQTLLKADDYDHGLPMRKAVEILDRAVKDLAPPDLKDEWHERIFLVLRGNTVDGIVRIRFDWTLNGLGEAHEPKEGLYLVATFEVPAENKARIVSHTCHTG